MYVDFEHSCFASQFLGEVVFRERYIHIGGFAFAQANQLVFKARDETAAAHFQRIAFAFAAGERFAVHSTGKVNDGHVALFQLFAFRSFYHLGSALLQVFYSLVHISVSDFFFFFLNIQILVLAQFRFRTQGYGQGQVHGLAFFEFGIFDFRIRNGYQLVFFHGCFVFLVRCDFKGFIFNGIFAYMQFQNPTGCFALAEAGNRDLLVDLVSSFSKCFGYILYRQSNLQGCFITISFYGNAHSKNPPHVLSALPIYNAKQTNCNCLKNRSYSIAQKVYLRKEQEKFPKCIHYFILKCSAIWCIIASTIILFFNCNCN